MRTAKVICPGIRIEDHFYTGSILFLCTKECGYGEKCTPRKFYEMTQVNKEMAYMLTRDTDNEELMEEFRRHLNAKKDSEIKCPSGRRKFKIIEDFTMVRGRDLGGPFEKYRENGVRRCEII